MNDGPGSARRRTADEVLREVLGPDDYREAFSFRSRLRRAGPTLVVVVLLVVLVLAFASSVHPERHPAQTDQQRQEFCAYAPDECDPNR